MSERKFDNADRNRVIRSVEGHFNVNLNKVGRRPKWRKDGGGRNYWIIGGYGDWHGIPEEMMDAEIGTPNEGVLVVAVRKKNSIDVYAGNAARLAANRHKLHRASRTTGDYQFTYKVRGTRVIVDQAPDVVLYEVDSLSYEASEKQKDIAADEIKKFLDGMSKEERAQLLKSLKEKEP